jgi:hypothetical protein
VRGRTRHRCGLAIDARDGGAVRGLAGPACTCSGAVTLRHRRLKHSVPGIVAAVTLDERTLSLAVLALGALLIALAIWVALLQRSEATLRRRLRRVLPEGEATSLDQVLDGQAQRIEGLTQRLDALNKLHHELEAITQRTIQKVGVVRYNPFADAGGDQSFAIALLDSQGTGIVVSSLHSRTETRVFAKPVQAGRSRYPLSDEEQDAIRKALAPTP